MSAVAPGSMRVSDVERAEVTNLLCRHYADGRLDEVEFQERASAAAAAKTRDDLGPLLADLPSLDVPPPSSALPVQTSRPPRHRHPMLRVAFLALLAVWVLGAVHTMFGMQFLFVPWPLIVVALLVLRGSRHRRHNHHHDWS